MKFNFDGSQASAKFEHKVHELLIKDFIAEEFSCEVASTFGFASCDFKISKYGFHFGLVEYKRRFISWDRYETPIIDIGKCIILQRQSQEDGGVCAFYLIEYDDCIAYCDLSQISNSLPYGHINGSSVFHLSKSWFSMVSSEKFCTYQRIKQLALGRHLAITH